MSSVTVLTIPSIAQIFSSRLPIGKLKLESRFQEPSWDDTTAFQNQFRFRSHEECADFEHPAGRRQPEADAGRLPQDAHEVGVGNGIWRGEIDRAIDVVVDEPED